MDIVLRDLLNTIERIIDLLIEIRIEYYNGCSNINNYTIREDNITIGLMTTYKINFNFIIILSTGDIDTISRVNQIGIIHNRYALQCSLENPFSRDIPTRVVEYPSTEEDIGSSVFQLSTTNIDIPTLNNYEFECYIRELCNRKYKEYSQVRIHSPYIFGSNYALYIEQLEMILDKVKLGGYN